MREVLTRAKEELSWQELKKTPDTELGRKLLEVRLENKLSVDEMARRIGRYKSTVTHYENGQTIPDAEMIKVYCREFRTSPNELLGWTDDEVLTEEKFRKIWAKLGEMIWDLKKDSMFGELGG